MYTFDPAAAINAKFSELLATVKDNNLCEVMEYTEL
jgi:hypothetical protein